MKGIGGQQPVTSFAPPTGTLTYSNQRHVIVPLSFYPPKVTKLKKCKNGDGSSRKSFRFD